MERLGKQLGLRHRFSGAQADRREAGDKHHLDVRRQQRCLLRQLDAIHPRHNDIGEEQIKVLGLLQQPIGIVAIVDRADHITRALKRTRKILAHRLIIFGQKNFEHFESSKAPKPLSKRDLYGLTLNIPCICARDKSALTPMPPSPPFRVYTEVPRTPVIISVPHAGRAYPPECAPLSRVPLDQLLPLEDRYADMLVARCIEAGVTVVVADVPRLWIDLNRDEQDWDAPRAESHHLSARARAGLGLIPTRLAGVGDIWRTRPDAATVAERLASVHRPYHAALTALLAAARARYGIAILLDVHSMPPIKSPDAPDLVVGDRFGHSAAGRLSEAARTLCTADGFSVAHNAPYAGGAIVQRHGAPRANIHALQIEIDRRCYLAAGLTTPSAGVGRVQMLIQRLAQGLAEAACSERTAAAAE